MSHPFEPSDQTDDEPRANSTEDLGWTPHALARYAGGASRARELPGAPLSTRSAQAFIDAWLEGEGEGRS